MSTITLTRTHEITSEASYGQYWTDAAGGLWLLTGHAARVPGEPGAVAVWTTSDEAGVDDVEVIDGGAEYPVESLETYARDHVRDIAGDLGTLVTVTSGHHYSAEGIQYQPASGYDRGGYAMIITPED